MAGPTRAEAVLDLIQVIGADYSRALTRKRSTCLDCNGSGVHVADTKGPQGEDDQVVTCARCSGAGFEEMDEFDATLMPDNLRPFVTGFKTGGAGRILPEFRAKDKAAAELMKAIGNGWGAEFPRDAFGGDAPASAPIDTKDAIIAHYERIAASSDPNIAMAALKEISKLRGYLTEDDETIDTKAITAGDVAELMNMALKRNPHAKLAPGTEVEEEPVPPEETAQD